MNKDSTYKYPMIALFCHSSAQQHCWLSFQKTKLLLQRNSSALNPGCIRCNHQKAPLSQVRPSLISDEQVSAPTQADTMCCTKLKLFIMLWLDRLDLHCFRHWGFHMSAPHHTETSALILFT